MPTVRGRYAPSPTGELHLGNLRTALLAWLFARHAGGSFVLRVEDLDRPRVRPGAGSRMLADLRWLGLDWDEGPDIGGALGPYTQSARPVLYAEALGRLRAAGRLYPCYCTRAELSRLASAPQGGDEERRYPGTCRTLSDTARQRLERAGRQASWRVRVPDEPVRFHDDLVGDIVERVAVTSGDVVVRRSDGIVAYQLAVVVDDASMDISQVVRGADLLGSTARQLALYDALGYRRPASYAHVPLALDARGVRLAKRDASAGVAALRVRGVNPAHVLGALAASSGLWPTGEPATLPALLAVFSPERTRRDPSLVML